MAKYYVSPSGSNTAPYDTWAKAATTLAPVRLLAQTTGDIIEFDGGLSGISYAAITTAYAGVIFRGSSEDGHNGLVTIDGVTASALALNHACTFARIRFKTTVNYTLNPQASGVFNDCIIGDDLAPKHFYTPSSNVITLTFNRCKFYKKPDGNVLHSISQANATVLYNNCKFFNIQDSMTATAGTIRYKHCNFIGCKKHSLITTSGAAAPVVTADNCLFNGQYLESEASFLIHHGATGGGGITVSNSYAHESYYTRKSPFSSTVTDGGGNIGKSAAATKGKGFISPRMPAFFVFMNENAEQYIYFDAMAKNLEARGGRGTWTVATTNMTATAWEYAADFVRRGHEVSSRTRQNVDLSDMKAFRMTRAGYTISIAGGVLTSSPAGLSLTLANYPTVTALVAAINAVSSAFNAVVEPVSGLHTQYGNPSPTTLSDVSSIDIATQKTFSHDQALFFEYQILGSKQEIDSRLGAGHCKTLTVYNNLIDTAGKLYAKSVGYTAIRGVQNWPYYPRFFDSVNNNLELTNIPSHMSRLIVSDAARATDAAYADQTPSSMPAGWQHGFDIMIDMMHTYGGIMCFGNYEQGKPISGDTELSQDQLAAVMDHLISRGATLTTMSAAADWIMSNATEAFDSASSPVALDSPLAIYYKVATASRDGNYRLLPASDLVGTGIDVGLTTDADGNAVPGAVGYDIGPYSYMPGWTLFDGSMPDLSLAADAPGKLKEVQEWTSADVTKKQIDKVSK